MIKSNLEPIEDGDLDMEGKMKRGETSGHVERGPIFELEKEKPQEIISAEKDDAYGKILSKVQSQSDDQVDPLSVTDDAKTGAQIIDAESQINHLIEIASQKGVVHAVKVAQHMQDNYILDTFHDKMLADELHDALLKSGMIKEI
ncbi:MAG: hypothetical protein ACD_8C00057G0025 [uncultured bacterium]|nr:MAG: hypothetical protein ACD_8C00057G0025 [uncultured bacterium]